MMKSFRYIPYLWILCVTLLAAGCADDIVPRSLSSGEEGDGDVTLTLNVSIPNSGKGSTRAEELPERYESAKISYEMINTLRVIIVRENNVVEHNRLVRMPDGVGVDRIGELEFKVSTDLSEPVQNTVNQKWFRTERKYIYLVANEASIPSTPTIVGEVKDLLSDLKEGETFTKDAAEKLIIYNEWSPSLGTPEEAIAMPFINNVGVAEGNGKYVPMSEFFEISVTENVSDGKTEQKHEENLFITRNLVKFRFSINVDGMDANAYPFRVTGITFNKVMQKEYLFPNRTEYVPTKYNNGNTYTDGSKVEEKPYREIIKYSTPSFSGDQEQDNDGNQVRRYVFEPSNFGFKGGKNLPLLQLPEDFLNMNETYSPELYFCETKTLDGDKKNASLFSVGIEVEFPWEEEVKDAEGKTVLDEDGNPVIQPVRKTFEAQNLTNLANGLPRNTIVDVKMSLKNGELNAIATVYPYTAVNLNPSFGFIIPVEKVFISERSKNDKDELVLVPISSIEIREGESIDLIGTVKPDNANNQDLVWTSGDPNVVTVSEIGRVTAKDLPEGATDATVSITATAADGSGAYATCEVNVIPKIPVKTITLSPSTWEGKVGSTTTLTATISPTEATVKDIEWTSSDPNVATVSSYGVVTAKKPGKATITATASNATATCDVQVSEILVESVTLSKGPSDNLLYVGQQFSFYATVEQNNATNQILKWESNNDMIATVTSYGLVTAKGEGTVTITAKATDGSGKFDSQEITIENPDIYLIKADEDIPKELTIPLNVKYSVRAIIEPANVFKGIVWTSDDEDVATIEDASEWNTVNSSVVYIIGKRSGGSANITATSSDNPEVSVTVRVTVN